MAGPGDLENYIPAVKQAGTVSTRKNVTTLRNSGLTAGGNATPALIINTLAVGPNVYYGSGAPTITAPQGSLYLRSDGSSTSTRMYINTTGSTTWTAVTTAA